LIPMYIAARNLLKNPPKDQYIRLLRQVQMANYIIFQVLENIWFLGNKGLISATTLNKFGGAMKLLMYSCRPWLIAIVCDFLRLAREAQLANESKQTGEKQSTAQEEEKINEKWYSDLFVSMSWFPMAVHYSVPQGIGLNTGLVGLSGVLAGSGNLQKMWAATKE